MIAPADIPMPFRQIAGTFWFGMAVGAGDLAIGWLVARYLIGPVLL